MDTQLAPIISKLASQCVQCGICLTHCPTYQLSKNEAESPRGRIGIISGIASGDLQKSDSAASYLDHCLNCRACEAVCPSEVQFGTLIESSQSLGLTQRPADRRKQLSQWLLNLFTDKSPVFSFFKGLIYFSQKTGVIWLANKLRLFRLLKIQHLVATLPSLELFGRPKNFHPAVTAKRGKVLLFLGCGSDLLDNSTIKSAIKALTYFGFDVVLSKPGDCCGALQLHEGDKNNAALKASSNLQYSQHYDYIISIVTGCGGAMKEYQKPQWLGDTKKEEAKQFSDKVYDISTFLITVAQPESVRLHEIKDNVVLQIPCSLANNLKEASTPQKLLELLPGINLHIIKNKDCCGAAGLNFAKYPQTAKQLGKRKIEEINKSGITVVASSNIGCSIHLEAIAKTQNQRISFKHPVEIFAAQISLKDS